MQRLRGLLISDPIFILTTAILGTVNIAVSFFDATGRVQIWLARLWARIVLAGSGIKVHVKGLDQIDPQSSYVFAANHASYMDTPVAFATIPVQFRFLAKQGLFKIPFLGNHLKAAGHIPVMRDDPRSSVKTLQIAAEAIQHKKISLLIFPEGGRSTDGQLQEFKEGSAYIAIKAGVPLVPMAFIGTHKVLPYGAGILRSGRVTLRVFPPIVTTGMTLKDRGRLTELAHAQILNALHPVRVQEQESAAAGLG